MSWVKVDDQFFRHPKVMAAGRDARDLYLVGLCYCAQALTDGFIPAQSIRVLSAEAEIDTGPASVAKLLETGLWETVEGGYTVHDYLEYQPSKERVIATREVRAEAGARGGKQKASNLLDKTASKTLANEKQKSTPYPSRTPSPSPTRVEPYIDLADQGAGGVPPTPQPLAVAPSPAPKSRAKRGTPAPDEFPISDEMREWADYHAPGIDLDRETLRFLNRARSKNETSANWRASWENWMTSPYAKPVASSARAPNGVYDLATRRPTKTEESLSAIGNFQPPEARRHP